MKAKHLFLMSVFSIQQTYAFDLPQKPIKAYDCDSCQTLEHTSLSAKWDMKDLPFDTKINNKQKSFSYKEKVTAEQLKKGVKLSTSAPGAVIRISPLQKKPIPELQLKTPAHQVMNLKNASSLYSEDEQFGSAGMSIEHQKIIQIKDDLGSGNFIIMSKDNSIKNDDAYQISVFDKFSSTYLEIETDSIQYQHGDKLTALVSLKDDGNYFTIDDIEVNLISPTGQYFPMDLEENKYHQIIATTHLNSEVNDEGKNWYVEADAYSDLGIMTIKRMAHTAISYAIPSASLVSISKTSPTTLNFTASVDVATASRYALQAVLYHKNAQGNIVPIETTQSGQWLEAGKQKIQFSFDNSSHFAEDSLFVGYLRLTDYGQLKTVYQYDQPIKLSQLMD